MTTIQKASFTPTHKGQIRAKRVVDHETSYGQPRLEWRYTWQCPCGKQGSPEASWYPSNWLATRNALHDHWAARTCSHIRVPDPKTDTWLYNHWGDVRERVLWAGWLATILSVPPIIWAIDHYLGQPTGRIALILGAAVTAWLLTGIVGTAWLVQRAARRNGERTR